MEQFKARSNVCVLSRKGTMLVRGTVQVGISCSERPHASPKPAVRRHSS
jgi:hypothetical protein